MKISNRTTGTICFIIASLTFALIVNDGLQQIAHHNHEQEGKEIPVSRSVKEYYAPVQGSFKD